VIDAHTQTLMTELFRRESRSLLQYLAEAFPWVPAEKQGAVAHLKQMAEAEAEELGKVARFLRRHRIPLPYLGAFPEEFTPMGFIGLDYAVHRLVPWERAAVAELEKELGEVKNEEAQHLIRGLLRVKQNHLKDLEGVAAGMPATTLR
jgi:hypothetical protein